MTWTLYVRAERDLWPLEEDVKESCSLTVWRAGLPHSLLHASSRHEAWRVLQWCHHEPERHSGRLIADDDVWHTGEVPQDDKDESASRTWLIKPWVTAFVTVKTDYIVVFIGPHLYSWPLNWLLMAKARVAWKRNISLSFQTYCNSKQRSGVLFRKKNVI